jgi:hypothetical protein
MADANRPSPFDQPDPKYVFAVEPPAGPAPKTVGELLGELRTFAHEYEHLGNCFNGLPKATERTDWARDANAALTRRQLAAVPGVQKVRGYILARYGEDLTVASAQRLLGDLIKECGLTVGVAEGLPLEAAIDALTAATAEQPTDMTPRPPAGKTGPRRMPTVNARMIDTIQADADAMGWNSAQWARHLRCAKSTVVETATWKNLTMGRDRARAEKAKDRRRKPKASDLNRQ